MKWVEDMKFMKSYEITESTFVIMDVNGKCGQCLGEEKGKNLIYLLKWHYEPLRDTTVELRHNIIFD